VAKDVSALKINARAALQTIITILSLRIVLRVIKTHTMVLMQMTVLAVINLARFAMLINASRALLAFISALVIVL